MNGSADAPMEPRSGVILAQTDGVDLTTKLSADGADQVELLKQFFSEHISVIAEHAARDDRDNRDGPNWRVVETSGDGMVFLVNVHASTQRNTLALFLAAVSELHLRLGASGMPIRSVTHYCSIDDLVKGSRIDFQSIYQNSPGAVNSLLMDVAALEDDVFGYERVILARLLSVSKGPFKILTERFIRALVETSDNLRVRMGEVNHIAFGLNKIRADYGHVIATDKIPIPLMKGLKGISFDEPYYLWEMQ